MAEKTNHFENVVKTKEFVAALNKSGQITRETFLETGFSISRRYAPARYTDSTETYRIGETGQNISLGDNRQIKIERSGDAIADGLFDFAKLHFHPTGDFTPSESDLRALNIMRCNSYLHDGILTSPVSIVAAYDERKLRLLMFQETTPYPITDPFLEAFLEEYDSFLGNRRINRCQQDDVAKFLNASGLYACEIVRANGRGIHHEDLRKLRRFSDEYSVDEVMQADLIKWAEADD